jgi:glycosyltransferase involved in cell wall biosynthesis
LPGILYTTTSYLPAIGGAQLHTHQIARRLALRHPVQVVTLWDTNRTDWLLGTTLKAPAQAKSYMFEDVPVRQITFSSAERWRLCPFVFSYYIFKPLSIRQIAAPLATKIEALAREVNIIHNVRIGREPLSFASLQVARKLDIPFVFTPYHHPRWVGWNYRQYLEIYRQADAVITLTQVEKQTLIELGVTPERIFVNGNGPNLAPTASPDRFRESVGLSKNVPIVLFLGQKYRYKGIEPLVAAAHLVWQKRPETHFLFIGPPTPFSKRFFAQALDARLIELGTVDLQQKTDALAACTLLCLPSTQESFGGVYTEAWVFSKPVIGADIPAVREVIENGVNGYLAPATAEALAERILYLLDNPSVAQQLGQAGRAKTTRQYDWECLAQKVEDVYTIVLAGKL